MFLYNQKQFKIHMQHKGFISFFLIIFIANIAYAQTNEEKIKKIKEKIELAQKQIDALKSEIKEVRLKSIQEDIKKMGLPKLKNGETVIYHSAMAMSYNEKHEQANWVAHIVPPAIKETGYGRSNDFREDPLIKTGSSCEKDYFLKYLQKDGTYEYDGFGYDRGHLAPSADFRWNKEALSESYFYSNMSPQRPDFNRGVWAKLESFIRQYVSENDEKVYVVTGGILKDNLARIERSINKVSIPEYFFKVVLDIDGDSHSGIAFILPNEASEYPVTNFAVSIDEAEKLTGIDFFPALPDDEENELEANLDIKHWLTDKQKTDVNPIHRNKLPKNAVNTVQARSSYNKKAMVCGTVVGVHKSRKGNYYFNIDKNFPDQLMSCTIWKNNIVNFSYDPKNYLINKKVCFKGMVKKRSNKPSMVIDSEKQIILYDDEMKKKRNRK